MGKVVNLDEQRPKNVNTQASQDAFEAVEKILAPLSFIEAVDVLARMLVMLDMDNNPGPMDHTMMMHHSMALWWGARAEEAIKS
jgi:hypothetical protein